jgi:hypothetical protein
MAGSRPATWKRPSRPRGSRTTGPPYGPDGKQPAGNAVRPRPKPKQRRLRQWPEPLPSDDQQQAPALPGDRRTPAPSRPARRAGSGAAQISVAFNPRERRLALVVAAGPARLVVPGGERGWLSEQVLPPPAFVYQTLGGSDQHGDLWLNASASVQRVLVGF